jgi:DNA transformation protein
LNKTDYAAFVVDQLAGLDDIHAKRMFGGYGLYCDDIFFGIIHLHQLFLKTDDTTRAAYVAEGMGPFQPTPKQTLKRYYEVPPDVIDDASALTEWARAAIAVARAD